MNLSSSLVVLLVILGIIMAISFFIIKSLRPSYLESLTPNSGTLHNPTTIGTSGQGRDLFLAPSSSTLSVYIFYKSHVKTTTLGHHNTNPIQLLQLGISLQLQIHPASIKSPSSTNLRIRTQGPSSENETIPIMDFPEQQWIHVCIVREGRRYTVYYNGNVAGSSRTQYFPTINSAPFILGDQRLQGTFAFPKLAPVAYTLEDIKKEMQNTSDTRHKPYIMEKTSNFSNFIINTLDIFTCPKGIMCFTTSSQPISNPLKFWKTPYA